MVRGDTAGRQAAPRPHGSPAPPPVPVLGLPADELHHAAQGDHCGQRQAAWGSGGDTGILQSGRSDRHPSPGPRTSRGGGVGGTYRERGG